MLRPTPSVLVPPGARERVIADGRGYVSIARLVASEALGRWVTRGEAVVPIDGDPWNWDPSNLAVRSLAASLPRRGPKFRRSAKSGSGSPPKVGSRARSR